LILLENTTSKTMYLHVVLLMTYKKYLLVGKC